MPRRKTQEECLRSFKKKHGDYYDYSKVEYNGQNADVIIGCPKHGYVKITPKAHLRGCGCKYCSIENKRMTQKEFKDKANIKHNWKYKYDKTHYINNLSKIIVTCPKHGDFTVVATNHLCGVGCKKCHLERQSKRTLKDSDIYFSEAKVIHNRKYDYSNSTYRGVRNDITIKCPIHGYFSINAGDHLHQKQGCRKCNSSKLEMDICILLEENGFSFKDQYKTPWLGLQSLDFYLQDYNIAIECQGLQHFQEVEHFGGTLYFNDIKNRDERKRKKCEENGVKLLYYSNLGIEYPYHVFEDKEELLKEIKKYAKD